MPPLYRLLSVRYLWHRWDRAALIVASIAVGVATLVSSRILNACLQTASAQTTTPLGVADLYISNGELGVLRTVADDIRAAQIPGVKTAQPLVVERVFLPDLDGKAAVLIGGELSWQMLRDNTENPLGVKFKQTLEENWRTIRLAISRRIVVLSKPVYDDWVKTRTDADAPFVVKYGSRTVECLPAGYLEYADDSPVAALGRNVVGMEISQAARFIRPGPTPGMAAVGGASATDAVWDAISPPRVNRVDVALEPGTDPAAVLPALEKLVNKRAAIRTPQTQGKETQEIIDGMQTAFTLCSAGAMVVGLFLVYNALSVTVAERRHDIGVLRSIGATRYQIVALFGASALVLGILGALFGMPMGTLLARTILGQFETELGSMFINPAMDPGWPTASTLALAAASGVLTAVGAALLPAVQAAYQDPADVVRRSPGGSGRNWKIAHYAICIGLVIFGIVLALFRNELPSRRVGAFGGMLSALIGLLLAAPILVGLLVRIVQPILRRVLPIEARLAADNLTRSPGRTGVVIGALGAGVAVMIQTAGVGQSNSVPVMAWLDDVIQADRFVFAGNLTEATSSQSPLPSEAVRELSRLPGVEGAVGIRYCRAAFNGTTVFVIAVDANAYAEHTAPRMPSAGHRRHNLMQQLPGSNRVLVSENFAVRHKVQPGDTIVLPGPAGPIDLEIAGTVKDYSWSRGTFFIDREVYARLFKDDLVDIVHVYLASGGTPTESVVGRDRVAAYAADKGLMVQDRATVRKYLVDLLDRVYLLAFLQQIVIGVVASLGVVTSLLISVLQRKRELGLLLAVGATPAQVVRSVLAEALLMGLFGTVLGIAIGIPMQWYVLDVVMVEESGFQFDLLFPWKQAGLIAAGALGVATFAGMLPALHAVRTRIADAIAYE